jgi:hypothetical protein
MVVKLLARSKKVPKTGGIEFSILVPVPPDRKSKSHKPWSLAKAVAWMDARLVAARTRDGEVIWISHPGKRLAGSLNRRDIEPDRLPDRPW